MIPFIPLQFLRFKTNLNMEQTIAILGRSVPLKREVRNNGEVVSFKYQPYAPIKYSQAGVGITVHVKYHAEPGGVKVSITIMPSVLIMLFYILGFGFSLAAINIANFTFGIWFILVFILFYLLLWRESIETKRAIHGMFRDAIIKQKE
jgi:hypothetical protein